MEFQRVCPFCAEPLDPQDIFCEACGRHLASAAERGEDQQPAEEEGDFELPAPNGCVQCGSLALSQDGYCEACGTAQPRPRDHQERELSGVAAVSDRGVRHHRNEDAFAVAATSLPGGESAQVAVVCDGVSSATRPDEASQTAADTAGEALLTALEHGVEPESAMRRAILTAAEAVAELGRSGDREAGRNSPACTFVGAIAAAGVVTVGWVGDSRAYWIPDDREGAEPYRLTEDDSWAAGMVAAGLMNEAEAYADARAHAITGWLGADAEEVEPHTVAFTPHVPGVLVVCTDGLWNYAEAATDLADLVRVDARQDPLRAARAMVSFAVAAGGHDNITVAVLPVLPDPAGGYTETLLDLPVITAPATAPAGAPVTAPAGAPTVPPVPPVPPHPPLPLPPR
ncbi:PP2C family serine/threonine-protein phosphatase [Kitasatospora sp. NBC_01266]|uniref:PP2C family serine/threonine-protein phosphatase n=1 Tax=Kitasatospora sp. NBC_01266 TaxID=2903572 RepID=UPI002E30E4E3|nr:PP2C family serine/threonine-protein phosphatase [Kitasatospora sp. NBC_01266]